MLKLGGWRSRGESKRMSIPTLGFPYKFSTDIVTIAGAVRLFVPRTRRARLCWLLGDAGLLAG